MTICYPRVSLQSGVHGDTRLAQLRESIKLRVRCFIHKTAADGWLGFLNSDPVFAKLVTAQPRLVGKIFRAYFSKTLTSTQRAALLIGHYNCILRKGWAPLVLHATQAGVVLGKISGKSDATFSVVLRAVEPMEREGELTLQLRQDSALVYSCAFLLISSAAGIEIGVGCLQGPKGDTGLAIVREATRRLYGARPKSLLLKLISALGDAYGCTGMRLVCNTNRAVRGAMKAGKVHADYDTFWTECGAQLRPDGDDGMPCKPLVAPDLALVASNKRANSRQRHALLSALTGSILFTLDGARR